MKHTKQHGMIDIHLLVALFVVVAVGAFVIMRISSSGDDSAASQTSESIDSEAESLPDDLTGIKLVEEIQALAEAEAGDSQVTGIELKNEDGLTIYVVRLSDGRVLAFNAVTGETVSYTSDEDDDDVSLPSGFTASVSLQEAVATAKAEHPGSAVKKVELETEDGVVYYSVRFVDGTRVDVSAVDGSIGRIEIDDDVREQKSEDDSDDADEDDDDDGDSSRNRSSSDDDESDNSGSGNSDDDDDDDSEDDEDEDDDDDSDESDDDSDDESDDD